TDSKPASSATCAAAVQNFGLMPATCTPIFIANRPPGRVGACRAPGTYGYCHDSSSRAQGVLMSIERFSLAGKVAIVTGGAGGCGEEYGRGLTAAGAQVVLADLDGERAEQHAMALRADGRQAIGVPVDITDQGAADAMVQRATDEFGGVDILINNAALMKEIPMGSILTLPLDWWERVMRVNVMGALVCSRAVVPSMLERGGGRIINQVSGGAFIPGGIYSISKLALVSLTTSLAAELGGRGINVNA